MHLIATWDVLIGGIGAVARAIPARSTLPILEGIYMDAQEGCLKLVCNDTALGIETRIAADVRVPGRVVAPGKLFAEIVRKLPEGQVEIEVSDQLKMTIRAQGSRTTLQCFDADEYPELAQIDDVQAIEIEQEKLGALIAQTAFAVASDEMRPILTGVLIELAAQAMNLVATDGFRLALRRTAVEGFMPDAHVVVPGKSLSEIGKALSGDGEIARIAISPGQFQVEMSDTRIIARLMEGEYIKYRQILNSEYFTRVKVAVSELADSIERASLMAREGKSNLIRFSVEEDKLIITSNSELGNVYEQVPITLEGKELEIAFNARYMSDTLKALSHEEFVYLSFTTNISPCVITPLEGDDFLYLVLPVRVYANS